MVCTHCPFWQLTFVLTNKLLQMCANLIQVRITYSTSALRLSAACHRTRQEIVAEAYVPNLPMLHFILIHWISFQSHIYNTVESEAVAAANSLESNNKIGNFCLAGARDQTWIYNTLPALQCISFSQAICSLCTIPKS